jgi:hypothetical protein
VHRRQEYGLPTNTKDSRGESLSIKFQPWLGQFGTTDGLTAGRLLSVPAGDSLSEVIVGPAESSFQSGLKKPRPIF